MQMHTNISIGFSMIADCCDYTYEENNLDDSNLIIVERT